MESELQIITSRQFDGHTLDCYIDPNQQDKGAFWATRTQIGELLEYAEPGIAIGKIHQRNKERLDKFSRVHQIDLPSGGIQDVTVYNFKGLLEICRYSQQPKANDIMDWLFDVADEIRRTGSYTVRNPEADAQLRAIDLERAKFIQQMAEISYLHLSDESKAVILHEAFKIVAGHECFEMLPKVHDKHYTATQLGEMFGVSSKKIGKIAKANGLKSEEGEPSEFGQWILTKSRYSSHQCSSFVYNSKAVDWLNGHTELLA